MALESASWITQFNPVNPTAVDPVGQGDDHLRMIKTVLQNSFPSTSTAAVIPNMSGNAGSIFITDGTDSAWSSVIYIDTGNSRVGVGTSSPGALLDVNGGDALINTLTVGLGAGSVATNTAVGYQALNVNTTGTGNIANGYQALYFNTTGSENTAIGKLALFSSTTGNNNTALGGEALRYNTTGFENVAIGRLALNANTTGAANVAVGQRTLYVNTTGSENTATGRWALYSNTIGANNTANGAQSLYSNTTGASNTATGKFALYTNTTGSNNTATGRDALYSNTTGTNNTALGWSTGSTITTGSNLTVLGYDAEPSSPTATNEITLGNSSVSTLRCNTQTISSLSDARDKDNITDLSLGLDYINAVRPVEFDWNRRDGSMRGVHEAGFIAQELEQVENNFDAEWLGTVYKNNPEKLETSQAKLIPILVKAVQELSQELTTLKAEMQGENHV
jgi:hypothetical protein